MIAGRVEAFGVHTAHANACAFVHIGAQHSCVALVAVIALTLPVARFIAALCIFDAKCGNGRIQTFVDIFAVQTVAAIPVAALTLETANGVLAIGEHVARSIVAFVFVCK